MLIGEGGVAAGIVAADGTVVVAGVVAVANGVVVAAGAAGVVVANGVAVPAGAGVGVVRALTQDGMCDRSSELLFPSFTISLF